MKKDLALVTVFAMCPSGGWHLICEANYFNQPVEINVYFHAQGMKVSLDRHAPFEIQCDPREFSEVDQDPFNILMTDPEFNQQYLDYMHSGVGPALADLSVYK